MHLKQSCYCIIISSKRLYDYFVYTDGKDTARRQTESRMSSQDSSAVRTRSDSRDRGNMDMPVLSRSTSRSEPQLGRSESRDRTSGVSRVESRDRPKYEASISRSKDSSLTLSLSRPESSKSTKSDSLKTKYESKHKAESPDKTSKHSDGDKKSKSQVLDALPPEPEHKEPIKLKLSLAHIRMYGSKSSTMDDSDSASSDDYEEPVKKTKKREGSSGKKKK